MEPDIEEDKDSAANGPGDIPLSSLSIDHVVQETSPDAPFHITVTFFSTVGQAAKSLLKASQYFVLLLSIVFDVIVSAVALLNRASSNN